MKWLQAKNRDVVAAENVGNMVIACTSHQHHIRSVRAGGSLLDGTGEESSVCEAEVNGFDKHR
jgi:hypothetical protein